MTLMIVDDSLIMQKAIARCLSTLPLGKIITAGDGETALTLFQTEKPDFVTMDITMPGMDGLECLSRMMSLQPACPVLVISALNDPLTAIRSIKAGARGFLEKPFVFSQLRGEVQRIREQAS